MLKLTLKPGEYIDIGDDVRVVFSGGSKNNAHFLIDAPKELTISRNGVKSSQPGATYYRDGDSKGQAKGQKEKAEPLPLAAETTG